MKNDISREHQTFMRKRADNHGIWSRRTLLAAAAIAPALGTRIAAAATSGSRSTGLPPDPAKARRDGQHDFDFEIGTWKTHLRRLVHPLSGSTSWVEYEGTTVVRRVWNGRANLVELEVDGPAGHIEALSLRLYNPETRQWSLNFSNSAGGTLGVPAVGQFENGRGEFFNREMLAGKAILVRFVISNITAASCHFEQAFSGDGGRSWEVNWIATDTQDASFHHGADGEHLGGQGSRVPATRSIKNISPDLGGVA